MKIEQNKRYLLIELITNKVFDKTGSHLNKKMHVCCVLFKSVV